MPFHSSTSSSSLLQSDAAEIRRALRALLAWLALALPLAGLLDAWFAAIPHTEFDRRMQAFLEARPRVGVLVLGSSQLHAGVDPSLLAADAASLAYVSQDLYYDTALLREHLPEMPALRSVILELSPFRMGYDLASTEGENRRLKLYDPFVPRREAGLGPSPWLGRIAILRARGPDPLRGFWNLLRATGARLSGAGELPPAGAPPRPERDNGEARARYHARIFRPERVLPNRALVQDAARRLSRRGVRLLLVRPPVAPSYARALPESMRRHFREALAAIQAETHAEFLDFETAIPFGQGAFRDADHLQATGREQFSRALGRRLREPTSSRSGREPRR